MREGVDTKGCMPVHRDQRSERVKAVHYRSSPYQQPRYKSSPDISSHCIAPSEFGDQSREYKTREERDGDIVFVLEDHNYHAEEHPCQLPDSAKIMAWRTRIAFQIVPLDKLHPSILRLEENPSTMREP
jgi:hypothetical protein